MDVVVLAGGKCEPELAKLGNTEWRALLPFGDKTIVQRVLDAVEPFGRVIVVGGPPGIVNNQLPAGKSFVDSLATGLEAVESDHFLLVTSDIPFLTQEAVQDFLSKCQGEAVLHYPIVRVKPGGEMKRTTINSREGRFTGGNLGKVNTAMMRRILPVLEQAYAARKKPLKLAAMVGFGTLIRLATGQVIALTLPISTLEKAVSRFLGAPVQAVITEHSCIGDDIDNAAQYLAALKQLQG